jgi:Topoisomerase DNA binding C4 zinc finger
VTPHCPRCGARMVSRHNRDTGLSFWGCPTYPRCRGTLPQAEKPEPPESTSRIALLHDLLQQVTRERDTLRVGYDQLLGEVRQLRRAQPRGTPAACLVRELTRLLSVVHPDKWGGESAVATAVTQEVLKLRERLQQGRL